jgi:hypothetical protein
MKFQKGIIPKNYIKLSDEQIDYLRCNYKTVFNRELGEFLSLSESAISKKLKEHGFIRTQDDIAAILKRPKKTNPLSKITLLKIEGGGRNGSLVAKWHLHKWQKTNGNFTHKRILVYQTSQYDNFFDLKLIRKKDYTSFITKRKRRLEKLKIREITNQRNTEKRRKAEKINKKTEQILGNYKQKTLGDVLIEMKQIDKVPVKLDPKTTIFVAKHKCIQQEDGSWIKK